MTGSLFEYLSEKREERRRLNEKIGRIAEDHRRAVKGDG